MQLWQEFRQPNSIEEAIEDLLSAPAPAIPIAGGTDLLLDMRQGRQLPAKTLVDLTRIPEMAVIESREEFVYIGACVPINQIIVHPLVNQHARALVEACDLIAGPQVRNIATLGGNVAHALPAADGTIALLALGTIVEIASPEGLHRVTFPKLFLEPGKSSLDKSCELIAGFLIPRSHKNQASAFKRIMRPQGVALPILNCSVWVDRKETLLHDVRIAVGPGGPIPFRATTAESVLRGQVINEILLKQAYQGLLEQGSFRTSRRRATSEYRKYILKGLFTDTFKHAWTRANE